MRFNSPPGWPTPPPGWTPPAGWRPDPSWPDPPEGWRLWLPEEHDDVPVPDTQAPPAKNPLPGTSFDELMPPAREEPAAGTPSLAATEAIDRLQRRVIDLEAALAATGGSTEDVVELSDQQVLQDVGIYRYHHPLEDAGAYKDRLSDLEAQVDEFVKGRRAVLAADMFTFAGSVAKGRRMVSDLSKLMLRAYNAEADSCVRSLRSGNAVTATRRLDRAVAAIEKLGAMMDMRVNPDYHALRVAEIELTADHQMKVQEERERAREERELLREQRRAEQELAAERERLEKERAHYVSALAALRASGDDTAADELAGRLGQIDAAIEANDYRIANIRAGYVYVISNVGAFGPNVVKIGMTRRLEPRDRVRELGDASVPFTYDIHALFFSDDAITLENELHKEFADRRVNWVNLRREFFFATPEQVRDVLAAKVGGLLEFSSTPEAVEYFQSRGSWPSFE